MADNIFGLNMLSPRQAQEQRLSRIQQRLRANRQNAPQQLGAGIGEALMQAFNFGEGARQVKQAEAQQMAVADAQKFKEDAVARGKDPIEAEMKARARAAATLRQMGGSENIALANQLRDSMTQLSLTQREEAQRQQDLKAQRKERDLRIEQMEGQNFRSKSLSEIEADLNVVNSQLDALPEDSNARQALKNQQEKLVTRAATLEKEQREERLNSYDYIQRRTTGPNGEILTQTVAVNRNDPRDIVEVTPPTVEPVELRAHEGKAVLEAAEMAQEARGAAANIRTLQDAVRQLGTSGGRAQIEEIAKNLFGTQDYETIIRKQVEQIRISGAIDNLPPGVASDKDIELVLSGTMPSTANPEALAEYLGAIGRVEEARAEYQAWKSDYISNNGARGINAAWEKEVERRKKEIAEQEKAAQQAEQDRLEAEQAIIEENQGQVIGVVPPPANTSANEDDDVLNDILNR